MGINVILRYLLSRADRVIDLALIIEWRLRKMSRELDTLVAQVAANTTVIQGAVTLIAGLRQQIIDAGTDPAKLTEITEALAASDVALANALIANTGGTGGTVNLASIAVTQDNQTVGVGATLQMLATGTLANGTTSDISSSVTWDSDNDSIATVSPTGLVTGVANGTTRITATSGTFSGAVSVTVAAVSPALRRR